MITTAHASKISTNDLVMVLNYCELWINCKTESEFDKSIIDFAAYLGFEYVLYAYMKSAYRRENKVHMANLSNPVGWMAEYEKKRYLEVDPVRIELERLLAIEESMGYFVWDEYERQLMSVEEEIIASRTIWGLRYGCSFFDNSRGRDSVFLASFASRDKKPDERTEVLCRIIIPHLNNCRKRLDITSLFESLTEKEKDVAKWLGLGKTNWEIASILGHSESTTKFHIANILKKLKVTNRQNAIAILTACHYL